ncbi:hypothetical protein [Sediminicola sp. 1XM1-17]|uniref:hypothetical protein n=1 Tax=Sediminicola sp. 1XM1-17 TaxID=3127702 RepID=UPI00307736F2
MMLAIGSFQVMLMIFMIVVIPMAFFVFGYIVGRTQSKSKHIDRSILRENSPLGSSY